MIFQRKNIYSPAVPKRRKECKPTAGTKSNQTGDKEVNENVCLIRLARFAIELCTAVIAFDMCKH